MQASLRKLTVAAVAATVLALGSISGAEARWGGHGGHWGGAHWAAGHWGGGYWRGYRGWGGYAGGLALGAAVAAPYYWRGYGYYGPYAYEPYAYAYGSECYFRRHVVVDRFGHRHIHRDRVCY